ncbi:MAG TPA: Z1 domain-containing protein [Nitratidesulfovibrio sp.]|nr:Z1 domain-containing protein [Nitratidesulfovibrio sp.]
MVEIEGKFYSSFANDVSRYSQEDRACIEQVVLKMMSVETSEENPGMLLGKIQSGKTKTFIASIACAFDNGFSIAVILTKGTKVLCKQTVERVKKEFRVFIDQDEVDVYDILNMIDLTAFELKKKLIIISKKQSDNLDRLIRFFENEKNKKYLENRRAIIVDDEADFASIGFRKDKSSAIEANKTTLKLDRLRNVVGRSAFLQVTATPYSLYLQPSEFVVNGEVFKPVRPAFTVLVPVNKAYVGSDFYFDENHERSDLASHLYSKITTDELLALRKPDRRRIPGGVLKAGALIGIRSAIFNLITGVAILRICASRPEKYSFLVHTESFKKAHDWQCLIIRDILKEIAEGLGDGIVRSMFKEAYSDLRLSLSAAGVESIPDFERCYESINEMVAEEQITTEVINSEKEVENFLDASGQLRLRTPINIFIGGQCLDRGITLANLVGFYYGRRPNKFQQDTVLQHSRMFGYRTNEQLGITRFYTEGRIYDAMRNIHEFDVALREEIEKNTQPEVVFIQKDSSGKIIPCNPNKILISSTKVLKPYKRILPYGFQTLPKSRLLDHTRELDDLLKRLPGYQERMPFKVNVVDAFNALDVVKKCLIFDKDAGFGFDWDSAKASLAYLARQSSELDKVWCAVFTGRNMARLVSATSHAQYTDAPDSTKTEGALRKEFSDLPMLIMLRQDGGKDKGWNDAPFYWPVISAQRNIKTAIFATEILGGDDE